MRGKDGQYRPFLTRVVPLRDSTAAVYGWIGTHIDISERKRSEHEIRSARDAAEAALRNLKETQNSLIEAEKLSEITGAAKGVFTYSQSSCHIAKVVLALTAAKSPQRLTRHLATPPAVSSIGGLRTPAPVRAAPPSWGRHPQTFTSTDIGQPLDGAPCMASI